MSTAPIHLQSHAFTSTLHDTGKKASLFNVWLVLTTAAFFFVVLSWYNFLLALYNYITKNNPNDVSNYNEVNLRNVWETLGFAVAFTIIAIILYFIFNYFQLLKLDDNSGDYYKTHPLARDIAKGDTGVLKAF